MPTFVERSINVDFTECYRMLIEGFHVSTELHVAPQDGMFAVDSDVRDISIVDIATSYERAGCHVTNLDDCVTKTFYGDIKRDRWNLYMSNIL